MKTIGERIKYLRTQNNWTVQQLADLINKTKGNVSSYENNKYEPSAQTIIKICEQFNVSADWLLTEINIKNSEVPISKQHVNSDIYDLNEEEKNLIAAYRHFDELDKELVKNTVDSLLKRLEKNSTSYFYIPGDEDAATTEKVAEEAAEYGVKKHA